MSAVFALPSRSANEPPPDDLLEPPDELLLLAPGLRFSPFELELPQAPRASTSIEVAARVTGSRVMGRLYARCRGFCVAGSGRFLGGAGVDSEVQESVGLVAHLHAGVGE